MSDNEGKARDLIAEAEKKLTAKPMFGRNTIVHFLPLFGCLWDSAWNCIPTVYSVARGSSYLLQPRFFSQGSVCVCGEFIPWAEIEIAG